MAFNAVVVGYGKSLHARLFHCQAIRSTEGLSLYGVCARQPAFQEEVRKNYRAKAFASLEEALQDERVDLVVISTPSFLHAEMALQALQAGKHVVVEKPMCLTISEAEQLIEAARSRGLLLMTRQNRRWDGDFLTVRQIIEEGKLGAVFVLQAAHTDFLRPTGWRASKGTGGGVLYDLGSHLVDQVLQLFDAPPVKVFAVAGNWGWRTESETYARLWITFADGALADIEVSHVSHFPRPRWYVLGERGSLISEGPKILLRTGRGQEEVGLVSGAKEGFYENVAAVLRGEARPAITLEESKQVIRILEAAVQSAASGEAVKL